MLYLYMSIIEKGLRWKKKEGFPDLQWPFL